MNEKTRKQAGFAERTDGPQLGKMGALRSFDAKDALKAFSSKIMWHLPAILLFVIVWGVLAFYEEALLFRINELSVFIDDNLFRDEMLSVPAGYLYYVASYLVQFFYNPVVGATIYVLLLAVVYALTCKVFDIRHKCSIVALLPVAALLASNTQLGYWIFYIKVPGYYYVAILAVIVSLLAAWVVKKSHPYLKPLLVAAWVYIMYPIVGVYALAAAVVIGLHAFCLAIGGKQGVKRIIFSIVTLIVALVMVYFVPPMYYNRYNTVPMEEVYMVGLPSSQWVNDDAPSSKDKESALTIIEGLSGKVGYPADKELRTFAANVDGAFTKKSIVKAKKELYDVTNINTPLANKQYTITFIAKNGCEYYLNSVGGKVELVKKEEGSVIPVSGRFKCVAEKNDKMLISFVAGDGRFLTWSVGSLAGNAVDGSASGLTVSLSQQKGNNILVVTKVAKDKGVSVPDNISLFGLVSLNLVDVSNSAPVPVVVGVDDNGTLVSCESPRLDASTTTVVRIEEIGFKPQSVAFNAKETTFWMSINVYWIPFYLLLTVFVLMALYPVAEKGACALLLKLCKGKECKYLPLFVFLLVALFIVLFVYRFWYNDANYRIENKQNKAMWEGRWEDVSEYARDTDNPTRQVVMNRNIALLKLGRSGDEMFTYPDGSADINAPLPVRLAQTGGKMSYFQYGKFNFCYRWCVEDAVEYGWRIEYLKHAVRSMLLSGEHRIAQRYINILKRTKFYASWAEEMETFIKKPELINREKEFKMPLEMTCYSDALNVDESYVEAYLTKDLMNASEEMSRTYVEAALSSSLTRKDSKTFWFFLNHYVNSYKVNTLPKHYQEAVLLFLNLDNGRTVQVPQAFIDKFISPATHRAMSRFMQRVQQHRGKSEAEMAPYFKDDFGGSYLYFYFFVRNIKTN